METSKKIVANIIILIVALPCFLIFNEGASFVPNFIGLAYAFLLYKYGSRVLPAVVTEYLASLNRKAEDLIARRD